MRYDAATPLLAVAGRRKEPHQKHSDPSLGLSVPGCGWEGNAGALNSPVESVDGVLRVPGVLAMETEPRQHV